MHIKITKDTFQTDNWAELLDKNQRGTIATQLLTEIENDEASRHDWLNASEEWIKLAMQVKETKSFPWHNAANVKYPLLTTASMQFHSRAQQSLLKGNRPIRCKILGPDPQGIKSERAERIMDFMGYKLKHQIIDWEDDVDRMLMVLPIVGMAFKKIYYSGTMQRCRSELVLPSDLIIHYEATDFERARKTHVLTRYHNECIELQRAGFFAKDVELVKPNDIGGEGLSPQERELYECHCYLDLDEDGYDEPYVVIIDRETSEMLRMSPRYVDEHVERDEDNVIVKIKPTEFFVRYVFLPSVESKLYGIGLGTLIGPTNMAANTLINQLIDAGTLSVLPSGFIGRGSRIARNGNFQFAPGEWKHIQSPADDLRKSIYPLPTKEPSSVLFNLLGQLIDSGRQIGSVADVMMGENPGQNQPFSTTQAVLEQGMKVFVGIYKRIYRSMSFEYKRLLEIISSVDAYGEEYQKFHEMPNVSLGQDFIPGELDLVPVSDPDMVSEFQKLVRAESLMQKVAMGLPLNMGEVLKRVLEAEDHENIEALMQVPPPEPPFEVKLEMQKMQQEALFKAQELGLMEQEMQTQAMKDYAQAMVNFAKAQAVSAESELAAARDAADAYLRNKEIEAKRESDAFNAVAGIEGRKAQENNGGDSG